MSRSVEFADRLGGLLKGLAATYGPIVLQTTVLLIAFKINRKVEWLWPQYWILIPVCISIMLLKVEFVAAKPLIILWQLIGFLSAAYSILHYPLMPLADGTKNLQYELLLAGWILTTAAGLLCFHFPSLAILPPSFLLWSIDRASAVSGLPVTIDIDILPLTEVSMCIGLGLLVDRMARPIAHKRDSHGPTFTDLVFLLAIAVHLANYFWSFIAKVRLDNSPLLWLTENNPAGLFLVALDDGYILFGAYPTLVSWAYWMIDKGHYISNFFLLLIQATALVALLIPKRLLLLLLITFDVMHFAIIVVGGLNFWPWIILNLIICYAVSNRKVTDLVSIRLAATVFILVAPRFVAVTQLGWLDSWANNKLSFEAIDKEGKHYYVPTNYFTYYSYPLGHMDYDLPDPSIGLGVGSPNGSVFTKEALHAGMTCDIKNLERGIELYPFKPTPFSNFIRNYHRTALSVYRVIGWFPYDLYPHHFYVPLSLGDAFRNLDKRKVVAYLYKQETVCMSFKAGRPQRSLIASAEYRIDVDNDAK